MIIPVRCFTCNMVLGSKYRRYQEIINSGHKDVIDETVQSILDQPDQQDHQLEQEELKGGNTLTQKAFRELEIKRYCCRRHLLTHIDLVDKI